MRYCESHMECRSFQFGPLTLYFSPQSLKDADKVKHRFGLPGRSRKIFLARVKVFVRLMTAGFLRECCFTCYDNEDRVIFMGTVSARKEPKTLTVNRLYYCEYQIEDTKSATS